MFTMSAVRTVSERFTCTIYGYFLGKRIAFPIVQNYVMNVWRKYGIVKAMMNSKGFYFFKFSSEKGVMDVLENGPWMVRNAPIFLNRWNPNICVTKENLTKVPIWVEIHDIPFIGFTEDG